MSNDIPKFDAEKSFIIVVISGDKKRYVNKDHESLIVDNIKDATYFHKEDEAVSVWDKIRSNTIMSSYDVTCVAGVTFTVILNGLKRAEELRRKDAIAKLTPYEKKILGVE